MSRQRQRGSCTVMVAVRNMCHLKCRNFVGVLIVLVCFITHYVDARVAPQFTQKEASEEDEVAVRNLEIDSSKSSFTAQPGGTRKLSFLVPSPALVLPYHNGVILSGAPEIPVYLIWYGAFTAAQKATIVDFFSSFSTPGSAPTLSPSVASWWKITSGYKDSAGLAVSPTVKLGGQQELDYVRGKQLKDTDIQSLVLNSLSEFPANYNALYLVLTADDVSVGDFCRNECGSHWATTPSANTEGQQLPFAWVGNPASQCPGLCAWPFAKPEYGPKGEPLVAPNMDVGIDGMIITIGQMLASVATNPFDTGFYDGDASAPLEASTACTGIYGAGAYPGYPGDLLVDPITGASYNANGVNGRQYLLPALWDPVTLKCVSP
ncbi:hypothetical protein R1sor_000922 [Riccia sorocarpa]|uniref:Uncharacterized protein n=1 Tax=Riccia sorocarpa TaxID=122646 RepID=A0ABD3GXQ8_9MARC